MASHADVLRVLPLRTSAWGARCETIRPGTGAKYIVDSGTDVKSDLFPLDIALLVKSSLKNISGRF